MRAASTSSNGTSSWSSPSRTSRRSPTPTCPARFQPVRPRSYPGGVDAAQVLERLLLVDTERAQPLVETRDVGELDEDGLLTITDRKKDIIVAAGGKNVSPQGIEGALKTPRFVSEALVIGEWHPYLVALVCLDHDEAGGTACTDEQARALVQSVVEGVNADRAGFEQIRRFKILPREFSADAAELAPTLKVGRHVAEQHFGREIEDLYAGKP